MVQKFDVTSESLIIHKEKSFLTVDSENIFVFTK
jgi:hypothetical protein